MKKIYVLLTLLVTFFIGSVSVKASVTCTYTNGTSTLVLEDGTKKTFSGAKVGLSYLGDKDNVLKRECPDELKGFYIADSNGGYSYYLYTSDYTNDDTYKNKKNEATSTPYLSFYDNAKFTVVKVTNETCTYTDNVATLVTKGGNVSGSIGGTGVSLKKLDDSSNKLKNGCVSEIKGFYIQYPNGGGKGYYLYTSGNYKETTEYKNAVNNSQSTHETVHDATLTLTANQQPYNPGTGLSKNIKCTYSNGEKQIIIENGSVSLNPSDSYISLVQSDEFKNMKYCVEHLYIDSYNSNPQSNLYTSYEIFINSPSNYRGTAIIFTLMNNGSGNEDPDDPYDIGLEGTKSCGGGTLKNIPSRLIRIINMIVRIIQIGVPVLLIILGMIDFAKSAMAQKEDEMKKGQKTFVSRLITAILVFLVIFVVKVAVRFVNNATESKTILSCVDCFISGKCD